MAASELVSLREVDLGEAALLDELLQPYLRELSEFSQLVPDETGRFAYPYLPYYWRDPNRTPLFIVVDDKTAGFALLRKEIGPDTALLVTEIAEFFIKPEFRRQGCGSNAIQQIVNREPAHWQIRVLPGNNRALHFWHTTLTGLRFEFTESNSTTGTLFELSTENPPRL